MPDKKKEPEFAEQRRKIRAVLKKYGRSKKKASKADTAKAAGAALGGAVGRMHGTLKRAAKEFGKPMTEELKAMHRTAARAKKAKQRLK